MTDIPMTEGEWLDMGFVLMDDAVGELDDSGRRVYSMMEVVSDPRHYYDEFNGYDYNYDDDEALDD